MILTRTLLSLMMGSSIATATPRKNFIFIMTDDQDLLMDSLDYQKSVQKHFSQEGTWFKKHYCTVSVCCPSRVSLLTGKAAHNTNVTDVQPPYGGYPKFIEQGLNDAYLPVWLQEAGYNTYYTGKMMNAHSIETYKNPRINGWNGSDFLIDPQTYTFYNATMVRNNEDFRSLPGQYSTDVISDVAVGFLEEAIADPSRPFFLGITPIAPHSQTEYNPLAFVPPVPAKRHEHLFPNVTVPRTPGFNPATPGSASYLKLLRQLNDTEITFNDEWYRKRLQSLQAVDELVDAVVSRLESSPEVLENTYLIYTSDNGFHIGQHRLPPGKACGIEEDVNIPFFIRGPGIAKGGVSSIPTSHTDIVPTIFELAGIPLREDFDGEPMPVTEEQQACSEKSEHVNIEYWGYNGAEPDYFYGRGIQPNNTYKSVRVLSEEYDLSYTVWCTNEIELYDMATDPHQLTNLHSTSSPSAQTVSSWPIPQLSSRLNALLLTLKHCKGRVCTRPWEKLHPTGDVHNLKDAMNPRFDEFYMEHQHQVSFSECALGQILSVEGELEPVVWNPEWDSWSWQT